MLLDAPPSSFHALQMCSRAGFTPQVRFRPKNSRQPARSSAAGFGWTLLIQRPQLDVTYEGLGVVVRPEVEPRYRRSTSSWRWSQDALLSRTARAFVDFAVDGDVAGDVAAH